MANRTWFARRPIRILTMLVLLMAGLPVAASSVDALDNNAHGSVLARRTLNVAYAHQTSAQHLDLYRPLHGTGVFPLVVYIHGGGFARGDKSGAGNVIGPLVRAGYAVASLNYRLAPAGRFPAPVEDVKAAVRFLRANSQRYGLDPTRFAAFGGSAGGYLATMLAVTANVPRFDNPALGYAHTSSAVQAVVSWFGPVDFLTLDRQRRSLPSCVHIAPSARSTAGLALLGATPSAVPAAAREASPLAYIESARSIPPLLIEHGTLDCRVPSAQTGQLTRALLASHHHGSVKTLIVAGAGHGPRFGTTAHMPDVVRFLARTLLPGRASVAPLAGHAIRATRRPATDAIRDL